MAVAFPQDSVTVAVQIMRCRDLSVISAHKTLFGLGQDYSWLVSDP